ncbi:hypothetical protein QOT17_010340 [Balamuthia mandrillaris]
MVPDSWSLLKAVERALETPYPVWMLRIDKAFRLFHEDFPIENAVEKKGSVDIHLVKLHVFRDGYVKRIRSETSLATRNSACEVVVEVVEEREETASLLKDVNAGT